MKKKISNFLESVIRAGSNLYYKSPAARVLLAMAIAAVVYYAPSCAPGLMLGLIWGTIPASSTASFNINFVPQFIEFIATTVPTSFQINVNGDGMIFNLDGAGLNAMTHIRAQQRQTNSYLFQLADGLLNNKNGSVTITNAQASPLNIRFICPMKTGTFYLTYNPASALAPQGYNLQQFGYAGFPNAATTDSFQITYEDGSLDNVSREELNIYLGYTQNDTITTAKYNWDNIAPARTSQVAFTPVASQTFYVMKYQAAYGAAINTNPNVQA